MENKKARFSPAANIIWALFMLAFSVFIVWFGKRMTSGKELLIAICSVEFAACGLIVLLCSISWIIISRKEKLNTQSDPWSDSVRSKRLRVGLSLIITISNAILTATPAIIRLVPGLPDRKPWLFEQIMYLLTYGVIVVRLFMSHNNLKKSILAPPEADD
ncbi:MAG: hypothetical protein LBO63_01350 [Oscillospiraceae bacterium]|jgi:hypothetical protein|nr:hypothetical protein [Oscillospiraceae bacterium]